MSRKDRILTKLAYWIGLPIVGVMATLIFQQVFFRQNIVTEQRLQLRREIVKSQYGQLQKLKRVAQLSRSYKVVVFRRVYMDGTTDRVIGEDKEGIEIRIPEVAYDTTVRREWKELVEEVNAAKETLDVEVYQVFEDILEFLKTHPWPAQLNLESLEKSVWTNPDVIGRWFHLNDYLVLKVDKILSLED
jgi:hypothetical protein